MSTPNITTINGVDICQTQYSHPDITTGQHTNGQPSIWVRIHPDGEWYRTGSRHMHKVRTAVSVNGTKYVDLCGWWDQE